ncbi:MAG: STM3941 family protein, partial [Deinococcota bacterium]
LMETRKLPDIFSHKKDAKDIEKIAFNNQYLQFRIITDPLLVVVMLVAIRMFMSMNLVFRLGFRLSLSGLLLLGVFKFASSSLYIWHKLRSDLPALVLDKQGIINNVSRVSKGYISWQDICWFDVYKGGYEQQVLRLHLCKSQRYTENAFIRWIYGDIQRASYKTVCITTNFLNIYRDEFSEFISDIKTRHSRVKGKANRYEVAHSKKNLWLTYMVCVLSSIVTVILLFSYDINPLLDGYHRGAVISGLLLILFSMRFILTRWRELGSKEPALIFDQQGIIDNASPVCAGRIAWQDIRRFKEYWSTHRIGSRSSRHRYFRIELCHPQNYDSRSLRHWLYRDISSSFYTKIDVPMAFLKINIDELLKCANEMKASCK